MCVDWNNHRVIIQNFNDFRCLAEYNQSAAANVNQLNYSSSLSFHSITNSCVGDQRNHRIHKMSHLDVPVQKRSQY